MQMPSVTSVLTVLGVACALAAFCMFFYGLARLLMLGLQDAKNDKGLSRSDAMFAVYARVGEPEYRKYMVMTGLAWLAGVLAIVLLAVAQSLA